MQRQTLRGLLDDLGRKVYELRREKGWTQAEAAEHFDTTLRHYQAIEAGRRNLQLATVLVLANGFGVPVSILFQAPKVREPRRPGRPPATITLPPPPAGTRRFDAIAGADAAPADDHAPTLPNPLRRSKAKKQRPRR